MMKISAFLIVVFSLCVNYAAAQRQFTVVKFNGDTLLFDELTAGGKTIVCKNKGQEKVKIPASEVSYYLRPSKFYIQDEGEKKAREVDTTEKRIVPSDGRIYIVQMENDSVYLTESTPIGTESHIADFFIFRKKDNTKVMEIKKYKNAPDDLKKYFGGSCDAFDKKLTELRPKFQKARFPYDDWYTLVYTYNMNCRKK